MSGEARVEDQEAVLEDFIRLAKVFKSTLEEELSQQKLQSSISNIYLLALYMRGSDLFSGIIVLAKARSAVCDYVLNRTLSECFAYAKACVKDPEFYRSALNKHLNEKVKRTASIRRDLSKLPFTLSAEELKKIEEFNKGSIDPEVKILADNYRLFVSTGLETLYHQVFAHCSLYAHNDSHTLDRYVDSEGASIELSDCFVSDSILSLMMATKIYFELCSELMEAAGGKLNCASDFTAQYNAIHDRASLVLKKD